MTARAATPLTTPSAVSLNVAAGALGVSRSTVCRLIRQQEIPYLKIGRRTLLRVADLETFLMNRARVA